MRTFNIVIQVDLEDDEIPNNLENYRAWNAIALSEAMHSEVFSVTEVE